MGVLEKISVREQDPRERAVNLKEVCLGYSQEGAWEEASRCINCKSTKCIQKYPITTNTPGFIVEVKEGKFEDAANTIVESSAFPAVYGCVCPRGSQCKDKYICGIKGGPISIGRLEYFVADWSGENGLVPAKPEKANGIEVAAVGFGPAGLTYADDLAKVGYEIITFEALHELDGVFTYGIPEFRFPKSSVVQPEINNVRKLGVKIEINAIIGKSMTINEPVDKESFKTVFAGSGTGPPEFMGIPGENVNGVFSANEYLTRSNLMKAFRDDYDAPICLGKKVAVVGDGDVAMGTARTALRLGAEAYIVYRRSETELPARMEEVHHAKEGEIIFSLLTSPIEILADDNDWIEETIVRKMELGGPDALGRRRPAEVAGSDYAIDVGTTIVSLGAPPDPLISSTTEGLETNKWKCIIINGSNGKTTKEGVYAGSDAVTDAATVILVMEVGYVSARGIGEYLNGNK